MIFFSYIWQLFNLNEIVWAYICNTVLKTFLCKGEWVYCRWIYYHQNVLMEFVTILNTFIFLFFKKMAVSFNTNQWFSAKFGQTSLFHCFILVAHTFTSWDTWQKCLGTLWFLQPGEGSYCYLMSRNQGWCRIACDAQNSHCSKAICCQKQQWGQDGEFLIFVIIIAVFIIRGQL